MSSSHSSPSGALPFEDPVEHNNNEKTDEDRLDEESASESTSETFSNLAMHLVTDEDFNELTLQNVVVAKKELNNLRVTRMSHGVRRLIRKFGDSPRAAEIIIFANKVCRERRTAIVLPLGPLRENFPNTAKFGLYSTRDVTMGEFIIAPFAAYACTPRECGRTQLGETWKNIILFDGLQSDFAHFQLADRLADPRGCRRRRHSSSPPPRKRARISPQNRRRDSQSDSAELSDEDAQSFAAYDKYDFCIDISDSSPEVKAIRRNCAPNCVIRYVLLQQRIEMFICARKKIKAGEELTLPHDYDCNFSTRILQCAHPFQPTEPCLHEIERQTTMRTNVARLAMHLQERQNQNMNPERSPPAPAP